MKKTDLFDHRDKIFDETINPAVLEKMPQEGRFDHISYSFDLDDTYASDYRILFEYDAASPKEIKNIRRISIRGIFPDGSGRMMMNYIFKGTKDEILAYMASPEGIQEIVDTITHLDESLRKHD
ncbi:MAG: hypothetical protein J1E40_10120 [Oscillospiraceae bacterium]|nr:hypothetical protein [Oscillospiraceae bacterium]